jgi:hypothetical protein
MWGDGIVAGVGQGRFSRHPRYRRRLNAWARENSTGAIAFRIIGQSVGLWAIVLFFSVGIVPISGENNGPGNPSGSLSGAQIDAGIVAAILVCSVGSKLWKRWKGKERPRWKYPTPPYDRWLTFNAFRPATVLMAIGSLRALAHFSDSRYAGQTEVALFIACGLTAIFLYVIGPLLRPQSILSSVAPFDPKVTKSLREIESSLSGHDELQKAQDRLRELDHSAQVALATSPNLTVSEQVALATWGDPEILNLLSKRADLNPAAEFRISEYGGQLDARIDSDN